MMNGAEEWLPDRWGDSKWLFHGGQSTVESFLCRLFRRKRKQNHLNFFEQMKMFDIDDELGSLFMQGFTSMHGPAQEFYSSNYSWDRTLWEVALTMDKE